MSFSIEKNNKGYFNWGINIKRDICGLEDVSTANQEKGVFEDKEVPSMKRRRWKDFTMRDSVIEE